MTIPNSLCGFQVLLVETDKKSLQHHAYVLIQNSYRVTSTMKISEALSMVIHENKFDCVLVDAQNRDMDLVDFLHTIWTHRPHLRVIVMTSSESHMQLGRENLANDVIWFLRKPCGVSSICSILQRVCVNGLAFAEGTSTRKSLEENRKGEMIQNVGTMHPSTVFNITMINNNTSRSNATHQGLNIKSHKYGDICKPVAYVDISSDDDEATANKSICTSIARNKDEGKKPMDIKRKNRPLAKDGVNRQKRENVNLRVVDWTPTFLAKFLEASTTLGKEGAYPKATLNHMNMPGLTRAQVASPLQRMQESENFSKKPRVFGGMQTGTNMQVESYAYNRSGLSTPSYNNPSTSSIQRAFNGNCNGISFMICNKVMARLPEVPRPLTQQITTTINTSAGYQRIESSDQFQPLTGEISMRGGCLGAGGSAASEGLAHFDRFGLPIESCVTIGGGIEPSLNVGLGDFMFPEVISHDLGGVSHPQDFQINGENLFDIEKDIDNFGQASTSSSLPCISGVENNIVAQTQPSGNTIVPFNGSEGRVIDNEWFISAIHDYELEDSVFSNNGRIY